MNMKGIYKTLILLATVVVFVSCGSDSDSKTLISFNGECKQTIVLEGAKDATITTAEVSDKLDDMLKNFSGYGTPISSGTLNPTETTSIKVTGLKDGIILKNFSLIINGHTRNFGEITASNSNLYTMQSLDYFN